MYLIRNKQYPANFFHIMRKSIIFGKILLPMYRLNISFIVEPALEGMWLDTMRTALLPRLREEGFGPVALSRVLTERHEGHFTFSLLVEMDSMEEYLRLTGPVWEQYASTASLAFGEGVMWFMSLMKELDN